ncbi:hypothetical protein R3P38DRAFT_316227 [Favolaschia claudopus]|uniref:Uncharacterized protein n=1 Tax=Favolaschia claudopus TaxID=2862362 RepID=A0AAW0CU16_9AGAR
MSGEDAAGACCGICLLCGFGALTNWCNTTACGGRGGSGGPSTGCCGSCCSKSFNEDSMDRWDKDRAEIRETKPAEEQPTPTEPMSISNSGPGPENGKVEPGAHPAVLQPGVQT